jgi:hypothetical protein
MWQVVGSHPFRFDLPGGYFLVPQTNQGNRVAFSRSVSYTRDSLSAEVFIGLARGVMPHESGALKVDLLAQFRSWHVANVVVPLAYTPDVGTTVNFLTWLLGAPSTSDRDGVTAWYRI